MGWLLLLMGLARAEMPGLHLVALPVAQVSLEAPEGGLGEENLEPLLRVLQGEPLDMADVRQDVALLVQVGAFASVEAWAEPWVLMGEHGEVIDAVRLVYSVRPAPRIQRIEVHGIRGEARRIALEALGLHRGATFFVDDEGEAARQRSESALRRAGWVDARVKLEVVRGDQVHLHVDGGQARVLGEVTLGGDKTMPELRILSWLQAEGVAPGGRRSLANLQAAQKRLERELVAEGWLAARVNMVFFTLEDGRDHLRVLVDAGTRTHFVVEGAPAPRPDELLQVLGLFAGDRVDEGRLGELGRRLERWLDARGHIHGTVRLDLREKEASADQILAIDIFAGARHRLRRLRFEGAEALNQITLAGGVKEAAEETLGKGIVSRAGMDVGLEAIRELYRGQGYLSTDVVLLQLEDGVGQEGEPAVVRTSPLIGIEEGLQTRLAGLSAHGGLGLEDARLAEAEATLVGEAYDPLALDRLAGDIRALYQDQGHLYAEVRLSVDLSASEDLALARVDIQPGEPFRLRSVVIRGNRRTRRGVIAREIGLKLGQPITPTGIAATRSNLYDLDLFRRVQPELVGEDDRARDLLLIVEEKPNILLEAGGGLATDQGVQAKVEATHRNLAGLGHRLSLLGQVGYGWRGDEWRFDTAEPVWRSALRYTAPELTGHHQALFVEGLINETVQAPTWRLSRSGGGLGLRVTPREGREWVVDYKVQLRRLEDVDPGVLVAGDPWMDLLGLEPGEVDPHLPSGIRTTTGPSLVFVDDSRNDRFHPTAGTLWTGNLDFQDSLSGSPLALRGEVRMDRLQPAGPFVLDLGVRVGAGWVEGDQTTLALEDRFFLGGSTTLRGFQLDRAGPANLIARPDVDLPPELEPLVGGTALRAAPSHWVPVGGDAVLALSTELRAPLGLLGLSGWEGSYLVGFVDAGHLRFLDPQIQASSVALGEEPIMRIGVGGGIRVATPVGPAALELGINPWRKIERGEPLFVPHLSLGTL